MKKIFLASVLSISAIGISYAQTETKENKPERKRVPKEQINLNSGNIQKIRVEPVETVQPEIKQGESKPVRQREKMRPAPKAVSTVKPVEKTEKTVE